MLTGIFDQLMALDVKYCVAKINWFMDGQKLICSYKIALERLTHLILFVYMLNWWIKSGSLIESPCELWQVVQEATLKHLWNASSWTASNIIFFFVLTWNSNNILKTESQSEYNNLKHWWLDSKQCSIFPGMEHSTLWHMHFSQTTQKSDSGYLNLFLRQRF